MKKIFKFICPFLILLTIIFVSSCSNTIFELDSTNFNNTLIYNSKVDYSDIKIKANDEVISITDDMVKEGIDTTSVGEKTLVIGYEDLTFELTYYVKYKITFNILGEVSEQLVYNTDEIIMPELPEVVDKVFSHFTPEIPTNLLDNMDFKAIYQDSSYEVPSLEPLYEVTYGDTLENITLPSNSYGHWEFVDNHYEFLNIKELTLNVKFIPNDSNLDIIKDKINIKVNKKHLDFIGVVDTFEYDGKPHKVEYKVPQGVQVIEIMNEEYIDVGTYDYEIKIFDDHYFGEITGTLKINKAKININLPNMVVDYKQGYRLTLEEILNHKDFSYEGNISDLSTLDLELKESFSNVGTYEYFLTSNNDNFDVTFSKGTLSINKGNLDISKLPVPMLGAVTFYDLIGDIEFINDTMSNAYGTYSLLNPDMRILTTGILELDILFKPNDYNYNDIYSKIKVDVLKRNINLYDYLLEDTYTYDGDSHNILFDFKEFSEYIKLEGNDNHTNSGKYTLNISIISNEIVSSGRFNLTINKADPIFNLPSNLNATYKDNYTVINLGEYNNGKLEFKDPSGTFDKSGLIEIDVIFTPNDIDNYNVINTKISVMVNKTKATIEAKDYISNYNGKVHNIEGTLNHNETKLNKIIKKDNVVVSEIKDAGHYIVIFSAIETSNYEAISKEINVTINKIAYKDLNLKFYKATYLDKLDNIKLETTVDGKFVWENPERLVGNAGTHKHNIKFISNNINYLDTIFEVDVEVSKKDIDITITNNTFTYDGKPHTLEYEVDVPNIRVTTSNTYTNAGSYEVLVYIVDDNYKGEVKGTLIINKADPLVKLPDNLEIEYNKYIKELALPSYDNGKLEYINPNELCDEIGNKIVSLRFTPTDLDNYNVIELNININVIKAKTIISATGFKENYNGNIHEVIVTRNHKEGNIVFEYYLGDSKVDSILNAGTYRVVIKSLESTHYKQETIEIEVIILKIDALSPTKTINTVYGTKLNELSFEVVDGGHWEWVNPDDYVGDAGKNIKQAKFVPSNDNYNTNIVDVTIIVAKKKLNITIVNDVFDYDTKAHSVVFKTDVEVNVTGNITRTNVGRYAYTLRINDKNYIGETQGELVINKVDPSFDLPLNVTATYNDKYSSLVLPTYSNGVLTIDKKDLIFITIGNVLVDVTFTPNDNNYNIVKKQLNVNVVKANTIIDVNGFTTDFNNKVHNIDVKLNHEEKVNITFKYELNGLVVDSILNAGTYKVTITVTESDHYLSSSKVVMVTINSIDPEGPKNSQYEAIYGDLLSKIKLEENTNGKFIWVNGDALVGNVGKQTHIIKFIPNNSNYNEKEFDVEVIVSKKVLEFNIIKDTFTYDGNSHKLEYTLPISDLNVVGNNGYIDADTYSITLNINDNNYSGTITHNLIINKAKPLFDLPTNLKAVYGDKYGSVDLGSFINGKLTIDTPNSIFNTIGNVSVNVKFTPSDINNYEIVNDTIIINVEKANTIITAEGFTATYTGDAFYFVASINHSESNIIYSVLKDGKPTNLILEAGIYTITMKVLESTHYKGSEKVVTVVINPKETINPTDKLTAVYGTKLNELEFNPVEGGHWEWVNSNDFVGNAGERSHQAKFVPNDGNYEEKFVDVVITVTKKKLEFTNVKDIFDYDKQSHSVEYNLNADVSINVVGNISEINTGSYEYNLVIDELNYEGSHSGTLVINKVDPKFDLPTNLTAIYNDTYSSVVIPTILGGELTINEPDKMFVNVGYVNIDVTFTPDDSNYNVVHTTLKINVLRKETVITANNYEADYNGNKHDIKYDINHNERVAEIVIRKNGIIVTEIKDAGVYNVTISVAISEHYQDKTIEVIYTIKEIDPNKPLVTEYHAVYGDKLSSISLESNSNGKYVWVNAEGVVGDTGTQTHQVKFIPNNSNYKEKVFNVIIVVAKKTLTFEITKDTFTYDGHPHKLEYSLNVDNLKVDGNNEYTNANTYSITLTINDNNYTGTITHNLVIIKAKPVYELPSNLVGIYNNTYNTINLGTFTNGVLTFDTPNSKFNTIGLVKVNVTFTPKDTINYEIAHDVLSITIEKATPIISATDQEITYSGNIYNVNASVNNNESVITFKYELNDSVVESILNAGKYKVTISTSETDHYKGTSKIITVTVNPKKPEAPKDTFEAIYDTKVSELAFKEVEGGRFEWIKSDSKVGDVGVQTFRVRFIPENNNYLPEEFDVTINVKPKEIKFNNVIDQFVYDGIAHKVIYNLEVDVEVTGNISETNVGRYNYTLNINAKNYIGTHKGTLVITKADPTIKLEELNKTIGDRLTNNDLPILSNGKLTLLDGDIDLLIAGRQEINVKFIPNDIQNYNEKNFILVVNVNKKVSIITGEDKTVVYNPSGYTYEAKLNHNETTLSYSYWLNDKQVSNLLDTGNYIIKVSAKETDNYLSAYKEFNFIILDKTPTKPEGPFIASYGDTLSVVTLPSYNYGKWVWVNPNNLVGNVGDNTHQARFEAIDPSFENITIDLIVTVNKKYLEFNITTNEFTYDAKAHSIIYDLPIKDLEVLGTKEYINAGEYNITLTINDNNYEGEITTTLVIKKADIKLSVNDGVTNTPINGELVLEKDFVRDSKHTLTISSNIDKLLDVLTIKVGNDIQGSLTLDFPKYGEYHICFDVIDKNNYNLVKGSITYKIYIVEVNTNTTFGSGDRFTSLGAALEATKTASQKTYIVPFGDVELTNDVSNNYTIGTNVILYIPHETRTSYQEYNKDSDTGAPDNPNKVSESKIFTSVVICSDVVVDVYGRIELGANRGQGGLSGQNIQGGIATAYSRLDNNGIINLLNGSKFFVFGIIESSQDGRIIMDNGSYLYELFVITDWRGGSNAAGVYRDGATLAKPNNGISHTSPFNQFNLRNNMCTTIIKHNSNYIGLASIYTGKIAIFEPRFNNTEFKIFGKNGLIEALDNNSTIVKKFDVSTKKIDITLLGNFKDNPGVLKLKLIITLDIDTSSIYFPLHFGMNITLAPNSVFNMNYKYKMLPGFNLTIDKNAILNINGELIVYDEWIDKGYGWKEGQVPTNKEAYYPRVGLEKAKFVVNGTINVYNGFAGRVISNNLGVLNFSNAKNISLTSSEGWGKKVEELGGLIIKFKYNETSINTLFAKDGNGVLFEKANYTYDGTKWVKI